MEIWPVYVIYMWMQKKLLSDTWIIYNNDTNMQ